MSESDDEEYLNYYSASNTKSMFNREVKLLKKRTPVAKPPDEVGNDLKVESTTSTVVENDSVIPEKAPSCASTLGERLSDNHSTNPDVVLTDTARSISTAPAEVIVIESTDKTCDRVTRRQASSRDLSISHSPPRRRSKRLAKLTPTKKTRKGKKKKDPPSIQEVWLDSTEKEPSDDVLNYECNVKIVWKSSDVVRVPVRRLQKLSVVFEFFMKKENVEMSRIVLKLGGKTVAPNDTPHSLNLEVTDFLEGGIVPTHVSYELAKSNASKFSLSFQDSSKKGLTLPVDPKDTMKVVLLTYAEQIDKPLSALQFLFDGCVINNDDTPEGLSMEDGDVVDVFLKT